jgi:hypothetical protein
MAIPGSGFFLPFFRDHFDASGLGFDWTDTDHKQALLNDSATPVFATDTAWNTGGLTNTYEVYGGAGWAQGGIAPVATAVDIVSRAESIVFDQDNVAATPTTLDSAMALVVYDDTNVVVADAAFVMVDFGSSVSTTNGQLDITWATAANGGMAYIDLVP